MATVVPNSMSNPCLRFDSDASFAVRGPSQSGSGLLKASNGRQASGNGRVICLAFVLVALILPAPTAIPQSASPSMNGIQQVPGSPNPSRTPQEPDPIAHGVEQHMAERRNEDRQKSLVADTEKLLALAQQLKADVDKTNKDTLSIDVVKRAEQIEKLARSVKEKMRGN